MSATPVVSGAAPGGAVAAVRDLRRRGRARRRTVSLIAGGLALLLAAAALVWGDLPLSEVIAALTGRGSPGADLLVLQFRLPRVLTAVCAGAALGVSGHIVQSILRNPLASPDIIGVTAGGTAAAAVAMLVLGLGGAPVSFFAIGGALVASFAIVVSASAGGRVGSFRVVLMGIGASAMLTALVGYLITRAEVDEAQALLLWMTGSISGITWMSAGPLAIAVLALMPLALVLCSRLPLLQLGDDVAIGLGSRLGMERLALVVVAVLLTAVVTAAAGPIGFVAFVSPPIARRLAASAAAPGTAAVIGAVIVMAADLVAQHLLPVGLPVGVMTAAVGAPYLLWLLVRSARRGSA